MPIVNYSEDIGYPATSALSQRVIVDLKQSSSVIRRLAQKSDIDASSLYGLERRAAERLMDRCASESASREIQRYRERPPIEPIAMEFWHLVTSGTLSLSALARICAGGRSPFRRGSAQARVGVDDICVNYPDFRAVEKLTGELIDHMNRSVAISRPDSLSDDLVDAVGFMVSFLKIHPLPSGNGRVSRIIFQAFLGGRGLLALPTLPIGPVMRLRRRAVGMGLYLAQRDAADWSIIVPMIARCGRSTAYLVDDLRQAKGRPVAGAALP